MPGIRFICVYCGFYENVYRHELRISVEKLWETGFHFWESRGKVSTGTYRKEFADMSGKVLGQPCSTIDYDRMAHQFDQLPEGMLERLRMQSESRLEHADGLEQARNVFQQAVSSKLLNQNFGTSYASASYDENGKVYMEEPAEVSRNLEGRALPKVAEYMDQGMEEDGFSL